MLEPEKGTRLAAGPVRRFGAAVAMFLVFTNAGCAAAPSQSAPQLLRVYATSAAYPWLDEAYACAPPSVAIGISPPDAAQLKLRLGEPAVLDSPAFQVGVDDLLVVVQPQTAVGSLTLTQVRQLFSGQAVQWSDVGGADVRVQVWTYAQDEDIQALFERLVMQGQPIVSLARLAVSAQAMSDAVGANPGSIGFLPRRWKTGNTEAVFSLPGVPVLAQAAAAPGGALRDLIACMQSKE